MLELIGALMLLIGVFFSVMGVWGSVRFPDVFTRLHASSKVSSVGILGLLIASALLLNATAPKAIALGILILFSAPVAAQAIARSAYRDGCVIVGLLQNDLDVQFIDFAFNYTVGEDAPADEVILPAMTSREE